MRIDRDLESQEAWQFRETVRGRIREERKHLGITQVEFAERCDLSPAAICQIEAGNRLPMLPVLMRIAGVLMVPTDYILGKTDSRESIQIDKNDLFYRDFRRLSKEDQSFITASIDYLKHKNLMMQKK